MADCSIGYYSCFTVCFFTVQFTRWVGDFQLSNTSSTPKIGQKGNNYCVKLQQVSSELSDFPACSTDVSFGSKADICGAKRHVRFAPESDIKCDIVACPLWANSRHHQNVFLSEFLPLLSRARYKRYKTEARRHPPRYQLHVETSVHR